MIRGLPLAPALALWASLLAAPAAAELVEGVAAIVDDEVILLSEVQEAANRVLGRLDQRDGTVPLELVHQVRSEALRSLIEDKLILEVANRMQLETTPEEIDFSIERIAGEEGVSVESIYESAARQGFSRDRYRELLAGQIAKMKVLDNAVRSKVSISEKEVREIYDERYGKVAPGLRVRLRHILLPWPSQQEEARKQVRGEAVSLRERALEGEDFAALAARYSAAPTAREGGLTVFREGEVAADLAQYVFSLEPGQISPPIETAYGMNLTQIIDRYDPSKVEFEQVRDQIASQLYEQRSAPEIERWLAEVRKHHYIEIVAPDLR